MTRMRRDLPPATRSPTYTSEHFTSILNHRSSPQCFFQSSEWVLAPFSCHHLRGDLRRTSASDCPSQIRKVSRRFLRIFYIN